MAAILRAFIGITTIAIFVQMALGANHVVGGVGGWNLGSKLQSWASAQSFETGDTLTFSYGPFHSVVEVSKADYDACSITSLINSHTDGNTVITLSSSGKRYFICGVVGHCSSGMKVEINTVSAELATPTVNSGAPQSAQLTGDSSPLAPIMAQGVSGAVPDSTLSETVPIAQPSAGNCFSPVTKLALGITTSMMTVLVL